MRVGTLDMACRVVIDAPYDATGPDFLIAIVRSQLPAALRAQAHLMLDAVRMWEADRQAMATELAAVCYKAERKRRGRIKGSTEVSSVEQDDNS